MLKNIANRLLIARTFAVATSTTSRRLLPIPRDRAECLPQSSPA